VRNELPLGAGLLSLFLLSTGALAETRINKVTYGNDGQKAAMISGHLPPELRVEVTMAVRRLEENDQYLLEGQHAGWRVRHGVIYRRRLYIARNGARITGEESLFRPVAETTPAASAPIGYEIRFHLHPDVEIAEGPDDRTLFLGLPNRQRVWRFRCETALSVEDSRYWGGAIARQARQLVVRGRAEPESDGSRPPNRVRWALSRLEPAV